MATATARAVSAAVAAVLAAIAMQRVWPYSHKDFKQWPPPQFVLCETAWGVPCNPTVPTRWFEDFLPMMARHAGDIAKAGRRPVLVHVGAHDFRDDTPEYRPLLGALTATAGEQLRLVLVEPDQEKQPVLHLVHRELGIKNSSVTVVGAAMKESCTGKEVMYVFSDQLFEDFVPAEHRRTVRSSLRAWKSFDRGYPLGALEAVGSIESYAAGEGSAAQYDVFHTVVTPLVRMVHQAGNASDYLVKEPVACLSAESLMVEANIKPEDIVMLTIDAEGFDAEILSGFTKLTGLRPSLLRWEGLLYEPKQHGLISFFHSRGWIIGESGQSHSKDIVAVLPP